MAETRNGEYRPEPRMGREALVNLVTQCFEVSRDTFSPWYEKASRWYKLQRGFRQGKAHAFHSNLTIPLAFSMIQIDASKKTGILVGRQPYLTFVGIGPEDKKLARKRESLINLQLDDCNTFDKATKLFTGGAIYGPVPYRVFWNTKKELVNFRADLGTGERAYSGEETTFDGPDWEPVSPFWGRIWGWSGPNPARPPLICSRWPRVIAPGPAAAAIGATRPNGVAARRRAGAGWELKP